MQSHLFDYYDYKTYLNDRLNDEGSPRGSRSRLAEAIGCQSAYVSSVLRGNAHFTPEQAENINHFFLHSEDESDFFLTLLQLNRAGTGALRMRLQKQLQKISETRLDLKKKLSVKQSLSLMDQSVYYSEWYYLAIHVLISVPGFQNVNALSAKLGLPVKIIADAVQFLLQVGLVEQTSSGLKVRTYQIHLGGESPLIGKHHVNWRLRAVHNIPMKTANDVHYSSVVSLSRKDAMRIAELFIETIKKSKAIVRDSKEEDIRCLSLDFFSL